MNQFYTYLNILWLLCTMLMKHVQKHKEMHTFPFCLLHNLLQYFLAMAHQLVTATVRLRVM